MAAEPLSPEEEAALRARWIGASPVVRRLLATLDAARAAPSAAPEALREFAEDVARQWGYVAGGAISAGGLSTLEEAFAILGWDDPHALAEGDPAVCDEPGCGNASSSGWPSPTGYRWTCHEHSDFHVERRCNWPGNSPHWVARLGGEA